MATIDIALAVDHLLPHAKYRSAKTYDELVASWLDVRPVPSLDAIVQAWEAIRDIPPEPTDRERLESLENRVLALERARNGTG